MTARYRRAIEVVAVCVDDQDRTLMVRADGTWSLPGDQVRHGEHPSHAVVRAVSEQTGHTVDVDGLLDVLTDIDRPPRAWSTVHRDRIIYSVRLVETPVSTGSGTSHDWLPRARLAHEDVAPTSARVLGLAAPATENVHVRRLSWTAVAGESRTRRQRFAAYGLATDEAGRVLLTLISEGYPGAGSWHLPGGGTDFGETAAAGLTREIVEETGQVATITGLIGVSHRHQRAARGPEGRAMDWHGVRVVYRVTVAHPTVPSVTDQGGSTAAAAWFNPGEALDLPLTDVARDMISNQL